LESKTSQLNSISFEKSSTFSVKFRYFVKP
jgi:hypothetical protein